jgi:hypothetical protein
MSEGKSTFTQGFLRVYYRSVPVDEKGDDDGDSATYFIVYDTSIELPLLESQVLYYQGKWIIMKRSWMVKKVNDYVQRKVANIVESLKTRTPQRRNLLTDYVVYWVPQRSDQSVLPHQHEVKDKQEYAYYPPPSPGEMPPPDLRENRNRPVPLPPSSSSSSSSFSSVTKRPRLGDHVQTTLASPPHFKRRPTHKRYRLADTHGHSAGNSSGLSSSSSSEYPESSSETLNRAFSSKPDPTVCVGFYPQGEKQLYESCYPVDQDQNEWALHLSGRRRLYVNGQWCHTKDPAESTFLRRAHEYLLSVVDRIERRWGRLIRVSYATFYPSQYLSKQGYYTGQRHDVPIGHPRKNTPPYMLGNTPLLPLSEDEGVEKQEDYDTRALDSPSSFSASPVDPLVRRSTDDPTTTTTTTSRFRRKLEFDDGAPASPSPLSYNVSTENDVSPSLEDIEQEFATLSGFSQLHSPTIQYSGNNNADDDNDKNSDA